MGSFFMTPETRAEAAAWIAKARMDLRAARADLHAVPPITGDVTEPGAEEANTGLAIASEVVEVIVSCLDRIP